MMGHVTLPHPHLIILRCVATLALSAVIGQAGWAAAFLGGELRYHAYHSVGAMVTVAVCVLAAIAYAVLRRSGGPVNLGLSLVLAAATVVQYALGEAGETAVHVFLGVLIAMVATALTSWTYRHPGPSGEH